MVIDRFTKFGHFIAISHPYTAKTIATIFFEHIHKLHGLPSTIVSDRDPVLLSTFWRQLFQLLGTKMAHTSAYHPQLDGQTERLNQCLENFLRCKMADTKQWVKWLTMAEWWYNINFHTSLQATPFEAPLWLQATSVGYSSRAKIY